MCDRDIAALLDALRSSNPRDAWVGFLESYSPVLYQTARACTPDDDAAADCYLHICEQLARNRFRRLLKFKLEGTASFTTWLRVVARNLCFDGGKLIWTGERLATGAPVTNYLPFQDSVETRTMALAVQGNGFRDLFTPEFMKENCSE